MSDQNQNRSDKYDLDIGKQFTREKHKNFKNWDEQMDEKYGFIPLGDMLLPPSSDTERKYSKNFDTHRLVIESRKFNFMTTRLQIESQLKPDIWDNI